MFDMTSKFEINIGRETTPMETADTITFAAKYRCPAIIVPPILVPIVIVERSKIRAQYKIIAAIGFDSTEYALDKFKNLDKSVFHADGYDVLITDGKNLSETINEMKAMNEFIKIRINPTLEIRYVLDAAHRSGESVDLMLQAAKKVPTAYVRTDRHLMSSKQNDDVHDKIINKIKSHIPYPIKLSGNVTLKTYERFKGVSRFDVTVKQAKEMIKQRSDKELKNEGVKQDVTAFRSMGYSEAEAARRAIINNKERLLPFPENDK